MKKIVRITTVPMSLKLLMRNQLKFMRDHYEVVAVSSSGSDLQEVQKSQSVRTVAIEMTRKITPFKDLISVFKMYKFFKKEKPFIIHSHTPKAGLVAMLAGLFAGVPNRLHTVAGLPLMETKGLKRMVLIFVERLTYICSTKIYPNSFGLEKFILENHLAYQEKVKVLGNGSSNGIDTEYFKNNDDIEAEAKHFSIENKLTGEEFIYCFIGRVVKDKGVEELILVFDELSKSDNNIRLIIVGPFEKELDHLSPEVELILEENKSIIHTGYQNDVRPYLSMSDVFVFPSYREGFPNVVMQAGCFEIPCIVSDINGCNEIIQNGVNGLIIKPKSQTELREAMLKLHENDELRNEMSKRSRPIIEKKYKQEYVWDCILKEYKSMEINAEKS